MLSKPSFLFEDILELIIMILCDSFANVLNDYFYRSRFEQVFRVSKFTLSNKKVSKALHQMAEKGEKEILIAPAS